MHDVHRLLMAAHGAEGAPPPLPTLPTTDNVEALVRLSQMLQVTLSHTDAELQRIAGQLAAERDVADSAARQALQSQAGHLGNALRRLAPVLTQIGTRLTSLQMGNPGDAHLRGFTVLQQPSVSIHFQTGPLGQPPQQQAAPGAAPPRPGAAPFNPAALLQQMMGGMVGTTQVPIAADRVCVQGRGAPGMPGQPLNPAAMLMQMMGVSRISHASPLLADRNRVARAGCRSWRWCRSAACGASPAGSFPGRFGGGATACPCSGAPEPCCHAHEHDGGMRETLCRGCRWSHAEAQGGAGGAGAVNPFQMLQAMTGGRHAGSVRMCVSVAHRAGASGAGGGGSLYDMMSAMGAADDGDSLMGVFLRQLSMGDMMGLAAGQWCARTHNSQWCGYLTCRLGRGPLQKVHRPMREHMLRGRPVAEYVRRLLRACGVCLVVAGREARRLSPSKNFWRPRRRR
jgi:hypothetical protein